MKVGEREKEAIEGRKEGWRKEKESGRGGRKWRRWKGRKGGEENDKKEMKDGIEKRSQ